MNDDMFRLIANPYRLRPINKSVIPIPFKTKLRNILIEYTDTHISEILLGSIIHSIDTHIYHSEIDTVSREVIDCILGEVINDCQNLMIVDRGNF
jgi:hypothetical protein